MINNKKAVMKHDLILTAKGHPGTQKRMEQEFELIKLWEQPDRAAALKAAAPKIRALAHTGHSKVDATLMDALPKLEIIANFGVGVDQIDLDAAKQRGIIVTNTRHQAEERCTGALDRGMEFAQAALIMAQHRLQLGERLDQVEAEERAKNGGHEPFAQN